MDVTLRKKVWEGIHKHRHFKTAPTFFKAKREKGVRTPFPRVPVPLHSC